MKQGDLAIMVVSQLTDAYQLPGNAEVTVKIGDMYHFDNASISVYETAVSSLSHHQQLYNNKYLEVRLLSEPVPVVKNDVRYLLVDKIEVVREIPLEELRQNPDFDAACDENENHIEKEQRNDGEILEHYIKTGELSDAEKKGLLYDIKALLKLVLVTSILVVIYMVVSQIK